MTIRLLVNHAGYAANSIVDLDAATEAGLVAAKLASTDITGGVYVLDPAVAASLGVQPGLGHGASAPRGGSIAGPFSNFTIPPNWQTNGSSVRNYAMAFSLPDDFSGVQLLFMNHQATEATVDNHVVGAGATAWPGGVFNINAPTSGWSAPAGPVVIPAATGANAADRGKRPGMALGPRLAVRSIPRAAGEPDGGKYPLLFARILAANGNAAMPIGSEVANFPTLYDPVNDGMSILTTAANASGDFTTSNQAGWSAPSAREPQPITACFGAVITYDESYTTVMGLGDSIMAGGADGGSGRSTFVFKALNRIRLRGKRAAYYNGAISTSRIEQINGRGKDMFKLFQPDIVVIAPYTTNSPMGTQAHWDAQWSETMDMVKTVQAAGKIPVLTTPLPFGSFTPAQNGLRVNQLKRVIGTGLPYVNLESLCTSVGTWADISDTSDGTHLSVSGHDKVSRLIEPVLDALIA